MSEICLVTGGAGFIGSHLVASLARQGKPVRVLDNFCTGLPGNLAEVRPAPEVVRGDVSVLADVESAMTGVGMVYHLAALPSVPRSLKSPPDTHAACATGTLNVLDAARRAGVRRVVYAGSSSAYGGLTGEAGQVEDRPGRPLSPYAAAKLAGELYAQAFTAAFGLETVRLRFFNIFGPRQRSDSPYSGVIALFIAAMSEGRRPVIQGDGLQSRDFTYVDNAVQALEKAADALGVSGAVFNVGTGGSVTLLELVAALNRQLGTDLAPEHTAPRPGDVRFSQANIDEGRRRLGYEPTHSFEEGLRQTVAWYRTAGESARATN